MKVAFIQVDEYGAPARSFKLTEKHHNMNIILQITRINAYYLNLKSESPDKTLANITGALLLNLSQNKELWCFAYQYAIFFSRRTDNTLSGDVPYFLQHGTRPSYKHIKIWSVIVYIINGRCTRKKLDDILHLGYLMDYISNTGVILY